MIYTYEDTRAFGGVNGCPGHDETADDSVPQFAVSCPTCEPYLATLPYWKNAPEDVPLTHRQRQAAKRAERDSMAAMATMGQALMSKAQELVRDTPKPAARKPRAKTAKTAAR